MEWEGLTIEQLKSTVKRAANENSQGPDKLPDFWLKQVTSLQNIMANAFSHKLANPE